ncbi:activating signal cointegrator 1 complex subunit 1-like isoform X2 [Physella acuta]|uniref:activating signal cointegrator 1 complex subunit 1-like isoform X2 n=2 Tax=Physella acuta TaxID=109671 RepID=UPI0027DDE55B|nr:activating signal cointegrator 1 complex subunit 1-like isoform X2 [Physella acuta]
MTGMEVLKPEIILVGKRRYRKNDYIRKETFISDDKAFHNDSSITCGYESDEACDVNNEIFETPKGFSVNMLIPNVYFKYIIGKKGETKKRIEAETYTKIIIPSKEEALNENLGESFFFKIYINEPIVV